MMRIKKLLALATVAAAAVACNGISPTEPTATVASDEATATAEATAANSAIPDRSDCRAISEVELRLLRPTERQYARIEALYLIGDHISGCRVAPEWLSRPRDQIIQTRDPFVVRVFLTGSPVQVTAVAPNGVRGSIRVQ